MKIMYIECELIQIDLRPHVIRIELIRIESKFNQSIFRGGLNANHQVYWIDNMIISSQPIST